jgi:hypothetical protein
MEGGGWTAVRGTLSSDSAVTRGGKQSFRVESAGGDARIMSAPVPLVIGKQYELAGWVRSENLIAHDSGRSPIATGAMLQMASMPFDVHSDSIGGSREWSRLSLRFTATRAQDRMVVSVGHSGRFSGKVWFSELSIDEAQPRETWPVKAAVKRLGPAYRYPHGGWIYLHIEGEPYERGYQHGYLLAREIESYIDRCASQLDWRSKERAWQNGRTVADALFLRGFDEEILAELKGIAAGAAAAGAKAYGRTVDLVDIVVANTITELGELNGAMPMTPSGLEQFRFERPSYLPRITDKDNVPVTERCSAFAATGPATADGKMVIGHVTWWPLTLAEQTNIMLDIQPKKGHRMLIQSYPGGVQSGTDYYQNDAGMVLTETTIRQGPFRREGTPVAYRARRAIQYGTNVDEVVRYLGENNNGLYTNEWLIGDAKNNEVAMFELGTYKTRLWRSSKGEWFGGTQGFYWGCNNAKDLDVRLEYVPDPQGRPEDLTFVPAVRDRKWQELYREHKGKIDEAFAFDSFATPPLVSGSTMDSKVSTSDMAARLMMWAAIGKPNQREWVPGDRTRGNDGLYPSGYRFFMARDSAPEGSSEPEKRAEPKKPTPPVDAEKLWKGWLLPASDADLWLTKGSAAYYSALRSPKLEDELDARRARFRAAALSGDLPLRDLKADTDSVQFNEIAQNKGALLFDALRREMGDDRFYTLMRDFYANHTTQKVTTAQFLAAVGSERAAFFEKWLGGTGLPGDPGGVPYTYRHLGRRVESAIIVYGTGADAGSNRYAAEQLQKEYLEWSETQIPVRKDFEVDEAALRSHDVVFVGRPESNSALAAVAGKLGLKYEGEAFQIAGKDYASERHSLWLVTANPLDPRRMAVIVAGNSALETVRAVSRDPGEVQFSVAESGKMIASGFLK